MFESITSKKRAVPIVALICMIALALTSVAQVAFANNLDEIITNVRSLAGQADGKPTLSADDADAKAGEIVELPVSISRNPGIIGATLEVSFDTRLSLVGIANGDAFKLLDMTRPGALNSGCRIHWDTADMADGDVADGTVVTLAFKVPDSAVEGDRYFVTVAGSRAGGQLDVFDRNLDPVDLNPAQCFISVESDVPPHEEHSFGEWTTVVAPTCTQVGSRERICSVCGEKESEEVAALGHAYGEWIEVRSPSCTEKGVRERTCSACGDVQLESIAALGHALIEVPAVAPSCENPGAERHWKCSSCGKLFSDADGDDELDAPAAIPVIGHKWDEGAITKKPTCTEPGARTFTCAHDASHTRTEAMPAKGHSAGEPARENEVAAACDNAGSYDLMARCAECGEVLSSEHVELPALGHDWGEWETVSSAGCEAEGLERRVCSRDDSHIQERAIAATGHNWGEPTYAWSEDGSAVTAARICKHDASHVESETVEATSQTTKQPACEQEGEAVLVAAFDSPAFAAQERVEAIPALGHDWGEGTVTAEPTCTEPGVRTFTCAHDASHTRTEGIDALGHDYVVTVVAPTVEAGGYTLHECPRCGDSYQTDETGPLPAPKKSIAKATVGGLGAKAYTGASLAPEPAVALGGAPLKQGADYAVTFKNAKGTATVKAANVKAAGTYRVVIEGRGGYEGSVTRTFTINPAPASKLSVGKIAGKTYSGSALKPAPAVQFNKMALKKGADYTLSYKNNVKAGTATVTVKGKGNFTGSKNVTFKIAKASAKKLAVAKVANQKYTGKAIKPAPAVKFNGKKLKKGADYTLSYKNNKNAGTATITVKGKGNFTGTKAVKFKIVKPTKAAKVRAAAMRL